jgi:hypothetical protein
MRKLVSIALLLCFLLALAAPALAADQAQGAQAGQAQENQVQGTQAQQAQGTQGNPGDFLGRTAGKLNDLGGSLVPVLFIVAAIVLMFSARHGKNLLIWAVAGAFLLFGGWKLVVDFIRYLLS